MKTLTILIIVTIITIITISIGSSVCKSTLKNIENKNSTFQQVLDIE